MDQQYVRLGWNSFFEQNYEHHKHKGFLPGRVMLRQNQMYTICYKEQLLTATLSGKFRYKATAKHHIPAVGDWVLFQWTGQGQQVVIQNVLPRATSFVRKAAISGGRRMYKGVLEGGATEQQVIAANIDTVFIVSGLDQNFDLRRIERYLTLVYNSGAAPVIVLNKVDLCPQVDHVVNQVKQVAGEVPIHAISVATQVNMDVFDRYLQLGKTIVFLGSSGVGKSTLTNALLGEARQKIQTISDASGKGKHTTTNAELLFHTSGCLIMDTPGMKEVQLWGDEAQLAQSFDDISELAKRCKYSNCRHGNEPGCAVERAIVDGVVSDERLHSYMKQRSELKRLGYKMKQHAKMVSRKGGGFRDSGR
ncbi:ribosome small subunit-dependent GTPase A [Paenibacillus sp. 481]|uniref:ribosome small subunit-dependent GTPase A n=1 Tax=Paenibacillus sp. 481 TaxID=2835869 RepID=UPI001E629689|nr:ribosome small subunit-dependent GTPase A [Paenibacillus sp. 481]UHA73561.1 ribosome small subunit-dependent GTPase A [Paenibacillus sp. 481]